MSTTQQYLIFGLITLLYVITLGIFFYRLKYVTKVKFELWGILIILDILFPIFTKLIFSLVLKSFSEQSTVFLTSSIFLIVEMVFLIILLSNQLKIQDNVKWSIMAFFLTLWVVELFLRTSKLSVEIISVDRFRITPICFRMFVVGSIVLYFIQLYTTQQFRYFSKNPNVWISIGWLLFYTITATSFFPDIRFNSQTTKETFVDIQVVATGVASIFYSLAFWKSKEWCNMRFLN